MDSRGPDLPTSAAVAGRDLQAFASAASNAGAHGPWPARTYGDWSIDSKLSASVTKLRAHSSMLERSRSNTSLVRKTYR